MVGCILGVLFLAYYLAVKIGTEGERLTQLFLVLAVLCLAAGIAKILRRRRKSRPWPLWLRTFLTTSGILLVILLAVAGSRVVAGMMASPSQELDYLIILSEKELVGETEDELADRLDTAVEYLLAHPDVQVVVSGGWDAEKGFAKARVMYQYLVRKGVEAERIDWEMTSQNTRENLRNCISKVGGLEARVGIVSSDYFAYRALRTARGLGMSGARSVPSATPAWLWPQRVAEEILYVLRDKLLLY